MRYNPLHHTNISDLPTSQASPASIPHHGIAVTDSVTRRSLLVSEVRGVGSRSTSSESVIQCFMRLAP